MKIKLAFNFLRALMIGLMICPPFAAAQTTVSKAHSAYGGFEVPISKNGVQDSNRRWSPPDMVYVTGTTCNNPFDGEAIIVGVCVASTTASGYVTIRDTASVTSQTTADIYYQRAVAREPYGGMPAEEFTNNNTCVEFPDGIKISTGVSVCNSVSGIHTSVRYRKLKAP